MSETSSDSSSNLVDYLGENILIILFMLILYIIVGGYMEHKKFPFGHETSFAILLGIFISGMLYAFSKEQSMSFEFN